MEYRKEIFELVRNPQYQVYKLIIDDKCQIDDFIEEVKRVARGEDALQAIFRLIEMYSSSLLLPKEKFRKILDVDRTDVFEFKKKNASVSLRVYVIIQEPNIYLVRGGYKNEQKKDIEKLKRETKEFPK